MEDQLKDACNDFQAVGNLTEFKSILKHLIDMASRDQMEELADTILAGLEQDRSH